MMNIVNDEKLNIEKTILYHKEGVDLIPANIELSAIEVSLVNAMSRELILKSMVDRLREFYDYIIIDCMPSLGMMTINALACADSVLIPVQAAYLPVKGLQQLIKTIGRVKKQLNPKLKIEGILLTMVDNRTNYANQVKYKKVGGEEPGKELREKSYSFKEAANILGIHDCDLYDVWKNEKLEYITVDFVRRIPVDIFEKWYADQDVYRKVTHIPTAEELENDYICLQDAADLLGISREKLAKIARREEIGRLLDSTICKNKRWITRKSFQLFLNAQNVYYIMNNGDKQEESQLLQENETLSLKIKEYISRQDAAELAGVSVSTVTKWMQSGEFQCVGAGKVLRVHRQQFLNWLNEHREGVV